MAAAQEERFTRKKHDARFPHKRSHTACVRRASTLDQIDYVVFYDKPLLKFERLLETYLAFAPEGFEVLPHGDAGVAPREAVSKALLRRELRSAAGIRREERRCLFTEHHLSHAASAFFPSPFEEAAVLTMDGVGEWATTSVGIGRRQHAWSCQGDPFPAFAGTAVLGVHLLHRLQGQLRRIQGDGAGAVRRAEIRAS